MIKFEIYFSLFVLFIFVCCNNDGDNGVDPDSEVETVIPEGNEQYLTTNSDYIFDQERLHTFELNLPERTLAQIDANPAAEQYVEGSLTFEGETLSPVGIRYKGSVGAYVNCLSGSDIFDPSGRKTCTKLSMKIKINWNDPEARFYKLRKLQFHSQNLDPTQMHERLGYWLFREMGVPAPHSVHARLVINGNYVGLFALTEQIDGRFTRYHFDDGSGNLYKEIWPIDMHGRPYDEKEYLRHLKTNEEETPSAEMIRSFAEEISGSDQSSIQNVISNWMDINEIIALAVVDRTIRADDGPFHWYCSGGGCSNHNYFWYEEPTAGKLHLIPWDLDNAFENLIDDANPVTPVADPWGEITANCEPFSYGPWQIRQRSAACDKLTAGWVSFNAEYQQQKEQFISGPFSEVQVNQLLETWIAQIRGATIEANQAHSDAISISEWENALDNFRLKLDFARNN